MAGETGPVLVLWDIDRTLIESGGAARAVYARVFPAVTGVAFRHLAPVHGRTEPDILDDTLRMHGLTPTPALVERLLDALAAGFRAATSDLRARGRVLPGVWAALGEIAALPGVRQSVLTGNIAAVAHTKVRTFGLHRYLDLSLAAFGDDDRDRARLVAVARRRAEERYHQPIPPARVVLVGDTPNDVGAALAHGAHVLGVATGPYSVRELTAAGATAAVPDLAAPTSRQLLLGMVQG